MDTITEKLIIMLDIKPDRFEKIKAFLSTVTLYRLNPYIILIKDNKEIHQKLKDHNDNIKDEWDAIVELYRYNMRLSMSLYPCISILENVLKTRIDLYFKKRHGINWCFKEEIIFQALEFNELDRALYEKFYNQKINKELRERIRKIYKRKCPDLKQSRIDSKIHKIKYCCSIITEAKDYFNNKGITASAVNFIENRPTFNYWLDLLSIERLFWDESEKINISEIFENLSLLKCDPSEKPLKLISKKLDDIRNLRNYISHYRQIIGKNAIENRSVKAIYNNLIEILKVMGCNDIEWMIGDLQCHPIDKICTGNTFESIYNMYPFLHNVEIKARKIKEFEEITTAPTLP